MAKISPRVRKSHQRTLLKNLGYQTVYTQENIQRLIFHRPPTLVLDSIVMSNEVQYAVYLPVPSVFKGHAPKIYGSIHPGWILGEYAAQAGLVLGQLSQVFLDDPSLDTFESIPIAVLRSGMAQFTERPVRPGEIVLFHIGDFVFNPDELQRERWRHIIGNVTVSVIDTNATLVKVAEFGLDGSVCFQKTHPVTDFLK